MKTPPDHADPSRTAALLIAHGSRRDEANAELARLAEAVRETDRFAVVEFAYLELAEPDIPTAAAACVERGVERVLMMPYFLSPGRHVHEDLQSFRKKFESEYAGVTFEVCEPLGSHPKMVEVIIERLREAL